MGKTVSYRVDAISITLNPFKSLEDEMALAEYMLREPWPSENVRSAKGYSKANAKMLDIAPITQFNNNKDFAFAIPVQTRWEEDDLESGFIALSGEQLDHIDYQAILLDFEDILKGTRVDIACDIEYENEKQMFKAQKKINNMVGFDPSKNGGRFIHNKDNDILPGDKKGSRKITSASINASEGETMYIGSRSSKFMVRVYDKSAEVKSRVNEVIPPTLRLEIEAKKEVAGTIIDHIMKGSSPESLWHTLMDDHLKFKKGSVSKVMGIDKAEKVTLDYSKIEGKSMETWAWIDKQVAPAIKRDELFMSMSEEEKIEKLKKHFL